MTTNENTSTEETPENRMVESTDGTLLEDIFNVSGFLLQFVACVALVATVSYFLVLGPLYEPGTCVPSRMNPEFNLIPMLPPNTQLNREGLVASTDNFRLQNYIKFAGTSELSYKYRLLRYSDGSLEGKVYRPTTGHNVILFIPGHAGHFSQVRSLATEGSAKSSRFNSVRSSDIPDYYTIDFNGELSGLSGYFVEDQAQFVVDAIQTLMNLYNTQRYFYLDSDDFDFEGLSQIKENDRTKIVIVGHSMGGFIERYMVTLDKTRNLLKPIKSIVSLAAPQRLPLLTHDVKLNTLYQETNTLFQEIAKANLEINKNPKVYHQEFRLFKDLSSSNTTPIVQSLQNKFEDLETVNDLNSLVFVSVTGGMRDEIIPRRFTSLEDYHSLQLSTDIDKVRRLGVRNIDHLAITWCSKFLSTLSHANFHALVPDYRERSSITKKTGKDTGYTDAISQEERNQISRVCHDISTFSPNEECEDALIDSYSSSPHSYEIVTALLSYDRFVGFQVPNPITVVDYLYQLRESIVTVTPSYLALGFILGILCQLKDTENVYNPGDHLYIIIQSGFVSKVLIAVALSAFAGYLEPETDQNLPLFSLLERSVLFVALAGVLAILSYAHNGLTVVLKFFASVLPVALRTQLINYFVIVPFSIGGFVAFDYFKVVFEGLDVTLNLVPVLVLVMITLCVTLAVFVFTQLIFNGQHSEYMTSMLACLSLMGVIGPLSYFYQLYSYSKNLEEHLTNLFPHRTVEDDVFGVVKRIQATIPDIQEMQQTVFLAHKEGLRNNVDSMDIDNFVSIGLMTPMVAYFVLCLLQHKNIGKQGITRKNGTWMQARVKATRKGKNKKKKAVKVEIKPDSFVVEGEVIETKKLLNSHLNVIECNETKAQIVLTNDTEYLAESNVVQSSEEEKVQVDSVKKESSKKQSKDAIPLFKEGEHIRYRKIEFTSISYKHPLEVLEESQKKVACTLLETVAVILFFWGPTNTWILLPLGSVMFCALLIIRLTKGEELGAKEVFTKIEYRS